MLGGPNEVYVQDSRSPAQFLGESGHGPNRAFSCLSVWRVG